MERWKEHNSCNDSHCVSQKAVWPNASSSDTADELFSKAEATAKLTYVTQVNVLRQSTKAKLNDPLSLDKSSTLEKLILYNPILCLYNILVVMA